MIRPWTWCCVRTATVDGMEEESEVSSIAEGTDSSTSRSGSAPEPDARGDGPDRRLPAAWVRHQPIGGRARLRHRPRATAGAMLLDSYERIERIDYKSKRDVVTDADYASERLVIGAIKERFPGDAILAEESGQSMPAAPRQRSAMGGCWVIDPLDGTVNYANGMPFYCVSIGLVVDDHPSVGGRPRSRPGRPVCRHRRRSRDPGRRAGGRFDKAEPVRLCRQPGVIGRGGLARERRIAPQIRIHRRMGSAALALAYVANGRFDAFVQNGGLSPWDVAAAGLIAARAGAVVTDLRGGPWWNPGSAGPRANIVAAPPAAARCAARGAAHAEDRSRRDASAGVRHRARGPACPR